MKVVDLVVDMLVISFCSKHSIIGSGSCQDNISANLSPEPETSAFKGSVRDHEKIRHFRILKFSSSMTLCQSFFEQAKDWSMVQIAKQFLMRVQDSRGLSAY